MIQIITNYHDNPEYDTFQTDEQFINQYLQENNARLISAYYNDGLWFVVEINN